MTFVATSLIAAALAAGGTRTMQLGPRDEDRARGDPTLEVAFAARGDEELTGATLVIAFAPPEPGRPAIRGAEVTVNDQRVAVLPAPSTDGASSREVAIPGELLAPRNQLRVRLLVGGGDACAGAPGVWRTVRDMRLVLATAPVPLPDDLALLPLPFYDRDTDTSAVVPIVLGGASPERIRVAAAVARWMAVDARIPLEFDAHVQDLPDGRAIVLLAGAEEAARLGLDAPRGPEVRMADHPAHPGSNAKLLVVAGRDAAELEAAAERLPPGAAPLVGDAVALPARPAPAPAQPGAAPRWVPTSRVVRFADYPGASALTHDGTSPATLYVRFRVPPDLWIWPTDFVTLDLGWSERVPAGTVPPRLDVDMNGYFVATLPAPKGSGEFSDRIRLRIPREHMRGFNELRVHVRHAELDPCASAPADATPRGPSPHVELRGDSVLHVEGLHRYAVQPDVALFAFDGYPFTNVADLSQTAVVLPAPAAREELSSLLTILARFAQITGTAVTRAAFVAADAPDAALADKDLLVVAAAPDSPLMARWASQLPLSFDGGALRIHRDSDARANLELLGGLGPALDAHRALEVARRAERPAAIAAIESPVSDGRSAVFVTAALPQQLPPFAEFLGYAESRGGGGDLLVRSGDHRWLFRLGRTFGRGELDGWTRVRWFFASHWLALLPLLAFGVLALAREVRRVTSARVQARLAVEEAR